MQEEEQPTAPLTTIAELYVQIGFTPYLVDLFARVPHGTTDRAQRALESLALVTATVYTLDTVHIRLKVEEEDAP